METASSPHDFKLMLAAGGQRASGIEQVARQRRRPTPQPRRRLSARRSSFRVGRPNY